MFDKYKKGQIAVLKIQLRALEKGIAIAIPTVEMRYDLLLDDGKNIYRAQVKYAGRSISGVNGSIELDLRKETRNNGKKRLYTKDEIDVVLVYIPQVDKILWVGTADFDNRKSLSFRYKKPLNNQKKGIRFINDYIW